MVKLQQEATFPLAGIVTWGIVLGAALALVYALSVPGGWMLFGFFMFFYSFAGLVMFFSSDYAQQRWNPEGGNL